MLSIALTIEDVKKLMPGNWYAANDNEVYQLEGYGCVIQFYLHKMASYHAGNFATFYLDGVKVVQRYGVKKEQAMSFYKKYFKLSNFK